MVNLEEEMVNLAQWLSHPHELGKLPSKLEYVKTVQDKEGMLCHIFRYKKYPIGKWLLGISSEAGAFSEMQEYNPYTSQSEALAMMEMLKNYWKNMAKEMEKENKKND